MDKIDLLMQAETLTKSVVIPYNCILGFDPHVNKTFNEPIQSYLSGEYIEEAHVSRLVHDGEIYTVFSHEEPFGKTPKFFTLQDLEDYLNLMLRTSRTISIEEVETTHDVVLSDGTRSGLFAAIPANLTEALRMGKIDADIHIKSVRDERDIPEADAGQIIVRCAFSVWQNEEEIE